MKAYYVHMHGNDGYLYLQLKPEQDFLCWNIEYASNVRFSIIDNGGMPISVKALPDVLTNTFDFQRIKERIREIYQLHGLNEIMINSTKSTLVQ